MRKETYISMSEGRAHFTHRLSLEELFA